jgi:hypothetical protein
MMIQDRRRRVKEHNKIIIINVEESASLPLSHRFVPVTESFLEHGSERATK